jgi:hypothetical protein
MRATRPPYLIRLLPLAACAVAAAQPAASQPGSADPLAPRTRWLLLDSRIIEEARNARLAIGPARKDPANPLLVEERPWEPRFDNLYANVLYDAQERIYKCWYSPFIIDEAVTRTPPARRRTLGYLDALHGNDRYMGVCYAWSRDGLAWTRPDLSLIDFKGSRSNNIVLRGVHGAGIFRDDHDTDPARRYKLFGKTGEDREPMGVAFSPDGLHWSAPVGCPEIGAAGDTHNNAFWDDRLQAYVGMTRLWNGQRVVGRTVSRDFFHWSRAEIVLAGTPERQLYAMPTFTYAGIYLGLPMILDARTDVVDCELAWSPDGVRFERVCPGESLIPRGPNGSFDDGCVFAAACPVTVQDEIRLYYAGSDDTHGSWRKGGFGLAHLRPDGFAGYEPRDAGEVGFITTRPLRLTGTLSVNADAGEGTIVVEALGAGSDVLAISQPIRGDSARIPVAWTSPDAAALLRGHAARLRFRLRSARLYSFSFE